MTGHDGSMAAGGWVPHGLSIALIEPDIPQNAGNIGRLCVATGTRLILVRPLGFRLTDPQLRRAGMDYWDGLEKIVFDSLSDFFEWGKNERIFFLSSKAKTRYSDVRFRKGDILCLGSESSGFPREIFQTPDLAGNLIGLPMVPGIRCLNVSSAAAAVLYEAIRQVNGW